MVRCQVSFLVLALVGFFADSSVSLDVPRSFVRRAGGDDNTQMLHKMVQANEFNANDNTKRTLQVATKPTTTVTKPITAVVNATEDQVAGPIITDILVQIVEIVIASLSQYLIDIIVGIISGGTAAQGTVGTGLSALNTTAVTDALSALTKNLANVTTDATTTEDQVAGPIITDILVQIVEIVIVALADYLVATIVGIISGESSTGTSVNEVLSDISKTLANVTAGSTTEDQIAGPIITDILSQIVEVIIVAISQAIIDTIVGILTGASVASDSIGGKLNGAVNTTALTAAVTANVTVSINELTSSNKTLTEDQFIEAVIPEVIDLVVTALSDALINTIDETIDSAVLVELATSIILATTDPLIAFLITDILGIVVADESTLGSLNTTALDIAVANLGSDLAAASTAGELNADTIQSILAESLPAIIEAVILIFAQAIANAINDAIFGLFALLPSGRRRNLQVSNSTNVGEDQILTAILTIVINALVAALITAILDAIFGSGNTAKSALSDLQSMTANITVSSIGPDAVFEKVVDVAKDEPVKKLRGFLGGL
jgi:hypothetical protein